MGIDGVSCVRSMRDIGRRSLHGEVGVNGDRCPEGICCAEANFGEDSVKDGNSSVGLKLLLGLLSCPVAM